MFTSLPIKPARQLFRINTFGRKSDQSADPGLDRWHSPLKLNSQVSKRFASLTATTWLRTSRVAPGRSAESAQCLPTSDSYWIPDQT